MLRQWKQHMNRVSKPFSKKSLMKPTTCEQQKVPTIVKLPPHFCIIIVPWDDITELFLCNMFFALTLLIWYLIKECVSEIFLLHEAVLCSRQVWSWQTYLRSNQYHHLILQIMHQAVVYLWMIRRLVIEVQHQSIYIIWPTTLIVTSYPSKLTLILLAW